MFAGTVGGLRARVESWGRRETVGRRTLYGDLLEKGKDV